MNTIEENQLEEEEAKRDLPDGFVYLGRGLLKKKHFPSCCEDLIMWLPSQKAWKFITAQGAAHCQYAAKEGSEAHLANQ